MDGGSHQKGLRSRFTFGKRGPPDARHKLWTTGRLTRISPPMTDAPPSPSTPFQLSDFQRVTLKALVETIVPHLFENGSDGCGMPDLVEERMRRAPTNIRKDLTQALDVFGGRL